MCNIVECGECHREIDEYNPCDDCGESFHEECRTMTICDKCGKPICSECVEEHFCKDIIKI
jgi:hypothetical protein